MYHVILHSWHDAGLMANGVCELNCWHTLCSCVRQAGSTDPACLPEQVMRANGLTSVTLVAHSLAGVWAQVSRPWYTLYVWPVLGQDAAFYTS